MRIDLEGITKTFGAVRANDRISLSFQGGRLYAVLGENGAGKSTLMKILSGYQAPEGGTIRLEGKDARFRSPADALSAGVGMLHQDVLDVPNLTALENFILGTPGGVRLNRETARKTLAEGCARLGFSLDPDAYLERLTIGERQQLEIVRLLARGARVLILDEPTTGISADQKATLFAALRRLAHDQGITVILVSHKLEDVEALCDHAFVLRGGRLVGECKQPFRAAELVALMFEAGAALPERKPAQKGGVVFEAAAITIPARRLTVHNLSLSVHAGEVIGLAGLDGSGQREFLRTCAGLERISGGRFTLKGMEITPLRYHDRARRGIAYAPAGRLEEGLVGGLTIADHIALTHPAAGLWVNWAAMRTDAAAQIARYNIKGRPESPVHSLSGGNQQRTLIALLPEPLTLLLLEDPTRGLDVESSAWVWTQLLARREQGTAIIFLSPDLDEVIAHSDRVLVFYGGETTLLGGGITTQRLGYLIGGKNPDAPEASERGEKGRVNG